MATETRKAQSGNTRLADLGQGLEVWRIPLDSLREQDKNARVMEPQTFKRLVANIEKGDRLESLPFCVLSGDGVIHIVSGHHRTRAARAAGLSEVIVLVDTTGLSQSQIIAKQLAHNAIQGTDNDDVLSQLFSELDSVEDMLESHLDPDALGVGVDTTPIALHSVRVDFDTKTVVMSFLPSQLEDLTQVWDNIPVDAHVVGALSLDQYDKFVSAATALGKECEIRSVSAIMSKMIDVTNEWIEAQPKETADAGD